MGRMIDDFCKDCDCLDSNHLGLYCQILGNECVKEERQRKSINTLNSHSDCKIDEFNDNNKGKKEV